MMLLSLRSNLSELKTMDLVSILFSLIPLILSKEYKMKKTKCDTIISHMTWSQKSHAHVIQGKG